MLLLDDVFVQVVISLRAGDAFIHRNTFVSELFFECKRL